ncbi:replicase helicase endonuclease [Labeo rohita]|uniref:Replicase helicase endonuclease n=1 Tax=Labeo rohita TaxID=84645 RepID=A0A498NZQ7_LABRO|nr:replicase helicase endonuclease [Labeo rohita]
MPRKGKRSASQKQRRMQEASGGSSSGNSVLHSVDANPYVLSVTASHFQGDTRYKIYSRGYQCTCNALMFLAVHNERNDLQSFELDRILQRGDAVYTSVKRTLQSKRQFVANFLNFDELPSTVKTNSACYNILKHAQRVGFLKDSPVLGEYENLENTLQCLRADVSDALLLCGTTCIAVFRDRAGRFGYFDSHCRSAYGMPEEESTGTAVMLTFFCLEDLIERLMLLFQWCFDLRDQQQFDLLPVSFINQITESSARPEVSLNCSNVMYNHLSLLCQTVNNAGLLKSHNSVSKIRFNNHLRLPLIEPRQIMIKPT